MNYARPPFDNRAGAPGDRHRGRPRPRSTEAARFDAARPNQTAIPEDSFFYYDYAPFDPDADAARGLLEQAGVPTPLTMGLMVTDEFPESVTAAQVIASQLEPIGIDVEVEVLDFATWLDREDQGEFDAFMLSWLGNIDPADFYEQQHITGGSSNYQGYSNPRGRPAAHRGGDRGRPGRPQGALRPGREDHRGRRQLPLPLQPRRRAGLGARAHRLPRSGPTGRSTSTRSSCPDRVPAPAGRPVTGGAGGRQRAGLLADPPGQRRPGPPGPGHAVLPGGLRRAAGPQRPGPAAGAAVLRPGRAGRSPATSG